MINTPLYTGKIIELTELDPDKDGPLIAEWTKDPCTYKRVLKGKYHLATSTEVIKVLTETLKKAEERRDSFYFAVRTRTEPRLVGFARFPVFIGVHQYGDLRLDFENTASLKEFGPETLELMAYYGFMELNLFRTAMRVSSCEPGMIELLEQFGFNKDVQRREAIYHYGKYFDEFVYGMNKPVYEQLHGEVAK